MHTYAQLNNKNIVIGISQLSGEIVHDNMIDITDLELTPELGSRYDSVTGKFETPEPLPETDSQPTLDDKIEQLQTENTILLMSLTDIYSEIQSLKGGA